MFRNPFFLGFCIVFSSKRGFRNQFRTPSPEVRKPHFLRIGLPELLLISVKHENGLVNLKTCTAVKGNLKGLTGRDLLVHIFLLKFEAVSCSPKTDEKKNVEHRKPLQTIYLYR